jgi:hypothetical protein
VTSSSILSTSNTTSVPSIHSPLETISTPPTSQHSSCCSDVHHKREKVLKLLHKIQLFSHYVSKSNRCMIVTQNQMHYTALTLSCAGGHKNCCFTFTTGCKY